MKESLFKRVAAIESRGAGIQIRTLRDFVVWVAKGQPAPRPIFAPWIVEMVESCSKQAIRIKMEIAWQQWSRWLA